MNHLMWWLKSAKEINDAEKGVNYSEGAFNQLYEEALKLNAEHKVDLRKSTCKGMLIGATGVGLAWLGTVGVKKYRANILKGEEKGEEKAKFEDPEKMEDDEFIMRLSKNKNVDGLSELINEINKIK